MLTTEVFYSTQGEGHRSGHPSIFVRFFGCNMNCTFCDSKFSTDNDKMKNAIFHTTETLYDEILKKVPSFILSRKKDIDIVFTGGEPLIYKNSLSDLIEKLGKEFNSIWFETNGTKSIRDMSYLFPYIGFICSPKLANSGNEKYARYKPDILHDIGQLENSIFKFVMSHKHDITEINDIIEDSELPKDKIWLMPMGTTNEELCENLPIVAVAAKANAYNICTRLQVHIWGNRRGT